MQENLRHLVTKALMALKACGKLPFSVETVSIERTRDYKYGEYSSNIAMLLAKKVGMNPSRLRDRAVGHCRAEKHATLSKSQAPSALVSLSRGLSQYRC